jgi:Holliday junction resolvase-like predicted endonuclease
MQTYPRMARQPCRFDVVSVGGSGDSIEWIRDAFGAGE